MSDLQSKMGEGLSKLQGGIEQGKQKLQTAQQIHKLKQEQQKITNEKADLLLQLGEEVYRNIRRGDNEKTPYENQVNSIVERDHSLYQLGLQVEELQAQQEEHRCECGSAVQETDKFCGSCGKEVQQPSAENDEEQKVCPTCETENNGSHAFCVCCGMKFVSAAVHT
ncbi:zinc ribbon domain-containing protein [Bacillus shivajii]|uniref:zinc ribbon domain-containing protein n=1 Tax=Bacillus shivajii TaxID=1983719 RepID=UPI001CFBD9A7|nr:zinc ribbon domain-containing protein [Bacillus shivajii]UCZ52729.1 zinc ribbon domain-containing protein [Bacillus shivajii]